MRNQALRYLIGLFSSFAIVGSAVWLFIIAYPQGYLESGYAVWTAKQEFIAHCDLGDVLISGDSRAEAAIDPRKLSVPGRIIALGGETPIENYVFLRWALRCKALPHLVVIALAKADFGMAPPYLWENGARFGYVSYDDLDNVLKYARKLGDPVIANSPNRLGINGKLRNLLYTIRFPPLYFNALVSGQVWRRADPNRDLLARTRAALGHVDYVANEKIDQRGELQEEAQGNFVVTPTQNAFFESTLEILKKKKVAVLFVAMPVPDSQENSPADVADAQFLRYL